MKFSVYPPDAVHALKCELACDVLRSSGTLRMRVTGWSMLPSVWPGDTLSLERVRREAIDEGDIVLFARDRRLFVHRIVKKLPDSRVLTRGDAMPDSDPVVGPDELLGKVTAIVRNGRSRMPRRTLSWFERGLATLIRNSQLATRVVVGVYGHNQVPSPQTSQN